MPVRRDGRRHPRRRARPDRPRRHVAARARERARRQRHRAVHARRGDPRPPAREPGPQPVPARAHPLHRHVGGARAAGRARRAHPPRLPRHALLVRAARGPLRRPRRQPRLRRRGAVPRAARGRGDRRRRRDRGGGRAPGARRLRGPARRLRPRGGAAAGRSARARRQGSRRLAPRRPAAQHRRGDARRARRRGRRARPGPRGRLGHVVHAPRRAHAPRDARDHRLDGGGPPRPPHQLAGAVPRAARDLPAVRAGAGSGARLHGARRRRVRRQAGDPHRGRRHPRRARDRPAGAAGVHPVGRVHALPARHPMRVGVTVGATADGVLTALAVDVLSDTGAYGNHGPGVMFHGCNESIALYRSPAKRVDAQSVYTNNLPSGAFRGYGLGQVIFAIESALDELARELGISGFEIRRRNAVVPGDPLIITHAEGPDLGFGGSYGLDQCLDLAEQALRDGGGDPVPEGDRWLVGEGMAAAMIATMPPRGHFADVTVAMAADGIVTVSVGTAEFGNGTTTVHAQLAATALGTTPDRIRIRQSDTDVTRYDTGAFGSAGTVVAGKAVHGAATALADLLREAAAARTGIAADAFALTPDALVADDGVAVPIAELVGPDGLAAQAHEDGALRSLAFNVHAFRVAVDPATGEVRILRSVQAVDAGTVLNPAQLRGQVEGGTAQALGTAMYEEVVHDGEGRILTDVLRNYHIPQLADLPVTEVLFAATHDDNGPHGAKSMSEAPYNPVAPALANAVRDAIGIRPHDLPMSRDRVWRLLHGGGPQPRFDSPTTLGERGTRE
ncbi:xanthine dehydrogenase family protein molybdopterin-binding subunit [Clavibacter michiganensis]|uniref:xanthine dehydrogenase family protein molybdopterin-binding subunit n=1 Tax=Clavibacter michiganensis TaxID=28447 RepID=UPI003C78FE5A